MTLSSSDPGTARVGRGFRRAAQAGRSAFLWCVFFGICLLALLLSAARWWLPSYVERNQVELIQTIGENMGLQLRADNTRLNWSHWGPSLHLTKVHVEMPGIEAPLTLDQIDISVDILQLLQNRKLVVDEVTSKGIALEISRSIDGEWSIALNREVPGSQGTALQSVLAALSRFGWIVIEEASLLLRDDVFGEVYRIDNIEIVANNRGSASRFSIEADLPDAVGGHLRAVMTFTGDAASGFVGRTYASLDRIQLGELASAFDAWEVIPAGEVRDIQIWSQFDGDRLRNIQYQFVGERVEFRSAQRSASGYLDYLSVVGGWDRTAAGWRAWIDDTVVARDGAAWRPGLSSIETRNGDLIGSGQLLRIEDLRELATPWRHLPPIEELADWLEGSAPSGEVALWKLHVPRLRSTDSVELEAPDAKAPTWLGKPGYPSGLRFEAVVTDWRNARVGDVPGVENLDAAIRFDNGRFSVRLAGESTVLDAPQFFRVPLNFNRLAAQFDGSLEPGVQWLTSDSVLLETPHFSMITQLAISSPADERGLDLDVRGSLRDLDGRYVSNYYPIGAMNEQLRQWLERSIQGGLVPSGDFLLLGNSANYPFRGKEGRLDVQLDVVNLGMRYHPSWPELSKMNGSFHLNGIGVQYKGDAMVLDGRLREVDARIPDFRAARMTIDSTWSGDGDTLVSWLRIGPLASSVGRHFQDVEIDGPVVLSASPDFGLRPDMPVSIEGIVELGNSTVELKVPQLTFNEVGGRIPFNERGLLAHELEGEYQGSPIQVAVKPSGDQRSVVVEAQTDVDLGRLLVERGVPIADWVDGRSRWDIEVGLEPGPSGGPARVELNATSDLRGVLLTAPAPIAKDASIAQQMRVNASFGRGAQDRWRVQLGDALAVSLTSRQGTLEAMSIGAGMPSPALPERGVRARVKWQEADIERWYRAISRCCIVEGSDNRDDPRRVDLFLRVEDADWLGVPVGPVSMQINGEEGVFDGQLSGDIAEGRFRYASGEKPLLQADLSRLNVNRLLDAEFEISEAPPTHPSEYPAIDVGLRELVVDNLRFTDITLQTAATPSGLEITELVARSPLYTAQVAGRWDQSETGADISHVEFFAHTNDVGLAVADMGRSGSLTGGEGQFSMAGSWRGALWAPDLETIDGAMSLELQNGRVNGLDPGVGRLFGLLALQTLPQRLALDFSDLGDGLGYQTIKGEFELGQGKLTAKALLLEGPVGIVSVAGPIDLINKNYDQRIVVLPNVAGSLPLIGAFIGGPLTAASVFFADKVLRSIGVDVNQFGRRDYRLTGNLNAPELTPILSGFAAERSAGGNTQR